MFGVGFGQSINIQTPACNASGTPGGGCSAALGSANYGASLFRVGVDGTIPLPTFGLATSPVVPQNFSEVLSFQVDPNTKIDRSYNVDFSLQRDLPGGILAEASYVGRFARRLPQAVNFAQSPYMFVDSASKNRLRKRSMRSLPPWARARYRPLSPGLRISFQGLPHYVNSTALPRLTLRSS